MVTLANFSSYKFSLASIQNAQLTCWLNLALLFSESSSTSIGAFSSVEIEYRKVLATSWMHGDKLRNGEIDPVLLDLRTL